MESNTETRVFFMDESKLQDTIDMVKLRHPGTNEGAFFLLTGEFEIHEVLSMDEKHRSWFIDNTVSSNGQIYIPFQMDPLYFLLNLVEKSSPKAEPLDQLLYDEEFPESKVLLKILQNEEVDYLVDVKGSEDLKAFKFNEEKALRWLKKKCEIVTQALKSSDTTFEGAESVTSATYVNLENTHDEVSYLRTAHGIVSEYISLDLSKKLADFLELPVETKAEKQNGAKRRTLDDLQIQESKKPRVSAEKAKAVAKEEKKTKDLAKAASGTKNIMSFFKKK